MAVSFKTRETIFESMKVYLQTINTALTDFNTGSVLNSVFDTVANSEQDLYTSLENVYEGSFVATATGTDLDARVADFFMTRKQGTTAKGILTFSRSTPYPSNFTIPLGTIVQTTATSQTSGLQFRTTEEATLPVNALSIEVAAECNQVGSLGNVPETQVNVIPNPPAGIEDVNNVVAFSGGSDTETDDELRARVPVYLNSLSRGTKDSLLGAAIGVEGVTSASIVEPLYPSGYVSLYVADTAGTASDALLALVRERIEGTGTAIEAYRAAGIAVNVVAPMKFPVDVTGKVLISPLANSHTVIANCNTAINYYLSTLGLEEDVLRAKIIETLMLVSGVLNLDILTLEIGGYFTGDITVPENSVARAGTTISINPWE
jgi:uncharacterized phage protein gp47/JayE